MGASNKSDSNGSTLGLLGSAAMTGVVIGLSLATWVFFYLKSMPLGLSETTVVVGAWLAVAFLVKWAWKRRRNKS
jgi:hypothetical protein